tara:strand:+ start:506 stop:688 length:183 start_codon:yes stop_codon:yes gene_type:complete
MSNKSNVTIDVSNYLNEDEEDKDYIYLDVSRLTDDILNDLKNNPTYKDCYVEVTGVARWE